MWCVYSYPNKDSENNWYSSFRYRWVKSLLLQCQQLTERKEQFYEDFSGKYWAYSFHVFLCLGNMLDCMTWLLYYVVEMEPICNMCWSLIQGFLGARRLMLWVTSLYSWFCIFNFFLFFFPRISVIHKFMRVCIVVTQTLRYILDSIYVLITHMFTLLLYVHSYE